MQGLFDLMARWSPIGQGLFMLLLVFLAVALVANVFKYLAVMVRGWPPAHCEVEYEEEVEE